MSNRVEYSSPKHPLWVRVVYAVVEWVDNHPIYLLPSRVRWWRYRFYDKYCYCSNCVERRAKSLQEAGYKG